MGRQNLHMGSGGTHAAFEAHPRCLPWEEGKESACAMRGAGHSRSSRSTAGTRPGTGSCPR